MPSPADKAIFAHIAPRLSLSPPLPDVGQIFSDQATKRLRPAAAIAGRPSKSRVRQANQLAVRGVRLAQAGQHVLAVEQFQRSIELDPTVATVRHDLGLACLYHGRLEEAVSAFGYALSLKPDLKNAHMNLGNALDHLGREREAVVAFETAIRLDPSLHTVHARIGQIYLATGRRPQAEAAFQAAAAAATATGSVSARIYAAYARSIAGSVAESESLLRDLIAEEPACGEAYVALGQLLAENGRSEEAAANLERGMSLDPNMAAWNQLATNKKFSIQDKDLIDRMSTCLARPELRLLQRQALHFALGKAHDDIQDYATAIRHIDAANRIRATRGRFDRVTLARQTDHVIASAPPGYLARRRELGVEDATPILIVGMPRSGTTLAEQIVSSHPNVAAGGELSFWREQNLAGLGTFDTAAKPEAVRRLASDYLAVLRGISPDAQRVTDKLPFNFAHLGVIRQVFPRATIVHCRRNPIDTCLSIYSTDFQASFDFASNRGDLVFFYRQYLRLMAHWRVALPPERFIEVDYEALVADPEPLTRQLIAACGLEWNDACLTPHRNQRRIMTASLWQARQPIYRTSVERWRRYEPWLGELRELLPEVADSPRTEAAL